MIAPELVRGFVERFAPDGAFLEVIEYAYMARPCTIWDEELIAWAERRERALLARGLKLRKAAQSYTVRGEMDAADAPQGPTSHDRAVPSTHAAGAVEAVQQPHEQHPAAIRLAAGSRPGVRATSLEAYGALRASGRLSGQQLEVVEHFVAHPGLRATRQELARDLGLGINVVCGRVNELLTAAPPVLVERGRKRCSVTTSDVNALELA